MGGWSKEILEPTLALQSTAWIQNPSLSRVWQYVLLGHRVLQIINNHFISITMRIMNIQINNQ